MKTIVNFNTLETKDDVIFAIASCVSSGKFSLAEKLIYGVGIGSAILPSLGAYKKGVWQPYVSGGWGMRKIAKIDRQTQCQLFSALRGAHAGDVRAKNFLAKKLGISANMIGASNELLHGRI
jgi:hypothetical protein